MSASTISILPILLSAAQLTIAGPVLPFATQTIHSDQAFVRTTTHPEALCRSEAPRPQMKIAYLDASDLYAGRSGFMRGNEAVSINSLAAAIVLAESPNAILIIAFKARQAGLSDKQIAYAFGIAQNISPDVGPISQAFSLFNSSVNRVDDTSENVTESLNAAFAAGAKAIDDTSYATAGSNPRTPFRNPPFSSAGFQGGGPGGGGASPR